MSIKLSTIIERGLSERDIVAASEGIAMVVGIDMGVIASGTRAQW
jgi:hypothetical protein